MEIEEFIRKRQMGDGRVRVFDENGDLKDEHFREYGGISIDFLSAEWCIKNGKTLEKVKFDPKTFRFFLLGLGLYLF